MAHGPILETDAEPIPGYRLIARLGRGGYGEVWKTSAPGGMHKAIKFVFGDMEGFGDDGKGAEQEYKSLHRVKSIRHPFILSLERIDVIDGRLMIVTELADKNLLDRFNECLLQGLTGIPREELLGYMHEAAEALDLMNRQYQIQHLDIKPQNLFLIHNHIKVADFGLAKDLDGAKAIVTGGVTPMYAPPETFEGWISPQSDQYSLAIVYQEMLTGTRPFSGNNTRNLIMQHLTGAPDLSTLPSKDREAVGKALAKIPGERFASCGDFVKTLRDGADKPTSKLVAASPAPTGANAKQLPIETPVRSLLTPRAGNNTPALPALVTVREARGQSLPASAVKPKAADTAVHLASRCLPTEKSSDGVLFPTLLVGVGGTGLAVLMQLRRLILEQHGLGTLPHLRWLFIDTDPATIELAKNDPDGLSFTADEVYHATLHRPAHYLTRQHLPDIETWLSSELLYQMPRTPLVNGIRAFGRLAVCDHYHPLRQRLRSTLEYLSKPEHLQHSLQLTHLGLRSNHPRAYMVASLGGGTGSGMVLDLAYILRQELTTFGVSTHHLMGVFGLPTETGNAAELRAYGNARAALTELRHYEQSDTMYQTVFDKRERGLMDGERPFRRTVFFEDRRAMSAGLHHGTDTAAHIIYSDTLTPIGRLAAPDTSPMPECPHSLIGVRRFIWPYKDLIHAGSRSLARRMVKQWIETTNIQREQTPTAAIIREWDQLGLNFDGIVAQMQVVAAEKWGATIDERRDKLLHPLRPNVGQELPNSAEAEEVLEQLVGLYGRLASSYKDAGGEISEVLAPWVRMFSARVIGRFTEFIRSLYEQPGFRYAGANEAVLWLSQRVTELLAWADNELLSLNRGADREMKMLKEVFTALPPPGASRLTRKFSAASELYVRLNEWCAQRFRILCMKTASAIYHTLQAQIPELHCETKGYREKLRTIYENLKEPTSTIYADDASVTQPIFPDGAKSLGEAIKSIVDAITLENFFEFDARLQHQLANSHRTLSGLCSRPNDSGRELRELLIAQSEQFLADRIPILTASQALSRYATDERPLEKKLEKATIDARPPQFHANVRTTVSVLLVGVQEDESGTRVRDGLQSTAPVAAFSATPIVDEVIVFRENRGLNLSTLPQMNVTPVEKVMTDPMGNHSRKDIAWGGS